MPSKKQLALLHVAKAALGLSEEVYRDILCVQGGVESAKDLDRKGFDAVMKRFRELGFRRRQRRSADRLPGELPTPGQLGMIRHLWEDIGWSTKRRQGFARRVCDGHPWPQDREEANHLIEALKSMRARGYRERKGTSA